MRVYLLRIFDLRKYPERIAFRECNFGVWGQQVMNLGRCSIGGSILFCYDHCKGFRNLAVVLVLVETAGHAEPTFGLREVEAPLDPQFLPWRNERWISILSSCSCGWGLGNVGRKGQVQPRSVEECRAIGFLHRQIRWLHLQIFAARCANIFSQSRAHG